MNHLTRNEGVTGGGVPLPDELQTFEAHHIPAQANGSHEALGTLSVDRMIELSQLGQEAVNYVLDGNAITILGGHIVAIAEAKSGAALTEVEQRYLLSSASRLEDRDGDGQIFVPLRQRKPVTVAPVVKKIKDLKGNTFALYKQVDALLTQHEKRAL